MFYPYQKQLESSKKIMLENFRIIFQHFGDNCPRSNRAREGHSGAKSTAKKAEIKAKVDHQITA